MKTQSNSASSAMPRRRFLASTTAAAVGGAMTLLKPATVFGAEANSRVEVGLIGCGGRGAWIADLFAADGHYQWVACADYFGDRVEAVGNKHQIQAARRYTGLSGYRRLLEGKLDAVVIETPPYFHPEQAAAAVEAGKHVFIAKPIAVDAPGCLSIGESGRRATAKKLVFLVDFQIRANEHFREAVRRVHEGQIGQLIMGDAHYPWRGGGRGTPPDTAEGRLRQWYYVLELSGDFIVEQSIHSLDFATWVINADPVRAVGGGGRKVRPPNSIYDHFALTYWFPNQVPLAFTCIQSIPEVKDEITARWFGSEGVIWGDYFSEVYVRGKDFMRARVDNLYTTGAQVNIREFWEAITQGRYDNPTVAPSVRSNLTAVLGREAAYRQTELTLAALIKEGKKLEPDLRGVKG
ncbi:Gfo/Idh/MocA family oxidoreductase [Fontisphaera persica]|uniref:Gfo/Idh/MocA family protein n=1 Tax=Fontisphaera persica TaxID=2974023 RepID=UPI0024C04C94|nr:Gfo/Idh/MocA family oxidoreductase [Fontisphaera persica]WCJ59134.1 Gfo/Idh/MocA family oxidoreductase [Fontisphaera persica]